MLEQYGIRVYSHTFKTMQWKEFKALLIGIGAETPLGRIVSIRAEDDKEVLKDFTKEQHKIRNDWKKKRAANKTEADTLAFVNSIKEAFISMAGGVQD